MSGQTIDRGDVVLLPSGEQMTVVSVYDSYTDVEGEHAGPFVSGRDPYAHYLAADVELVAVNANRCEICGRGVTSKDPQAYPYCESCHYTGAVADRMRAAQIDRLEAAIPGSRVGVEHTGGGCFWMAVRFDGDDAYYVLTDGEASLPEQDSGGWGYVGRHSDDEASPDYDGTPLRDVRGRASTDAGAAAMIVADRAGRGSS